MITLDKINLDTYATRKRNYFITRAGESWKAHRTDTNVRTNGECLGWEKKLEDCAFVCMMDRGLSDRTRLMILGSLATVLVLIAAGSMLG